MQQNLQLVVQVAKEYTEQLGADKIIELLEGVKSYHGLYYYLGSYLAFSEDPEVRFRASCIYPLVYPQSLYPPIQPDTWKLGTAASTWAPTSCEGGWDSEAYKPVPIPSHQS